MIPDVSRQYDLAEQPGQVTPRSAERALPMLMTGLTDGGCRDGFQWRVYECNDEMIKDLTDPGEQYPPAERGPRRRQITIYLVEAP